MRAPLLAILILLGAPGPAPAQTRARAVASALAEEDWFSSVYSAGGLEVRADGRVFTLFALLNRLGYDAGSRYREHPVPAYRYGPARTRVREALVTASPVVLADAQAFFDAHPVPVEDYLARLLAGPQASEAARRLDGLETLLARVEAEWPVAALRAETLDLYRAEQRAWLPLLDAPLQQAARLLGLPEGKPALEVVVNLLDAEGSIRRVEAGRGWVLVVGPATRRPEMEPVVREFARSVLSSRMGARLESRWTGGVGTLREARGAGAAEATVGEYGVALLSRALALRATDAQEAAYEAAGRQGYFGLKALARSFEDSRPVDAWALDGLSRVRPGPAHRK
ncbi:hypothetical protein JY651_15135 [Pyxidicoccus parkwayensis]|uniref:Insulinase family protein n=1 Tax=Pyxidicoccus parkwayensis TaxID=2813578 RepID=A0ABX7P6S4_9BACT|nr:hypothetical protein [Pyxidicoccus parkwaysis]QSQ26180.1 hypothetical protein JY651_15135 [Pyxidicoccus parkwaysis]